MTGAAGTLLLVGCGKMGGALLRGWLARGRDPRTIIVVEPAESMAREAGGGAVRVVAQADALAPEVTPMVVVFATKPQGMDQIVPAYRRFAGGAVFLSIAAGRRIEFFERHLGPVAVVRAMPNTPAAVGRGMSVLCANPRAGAAERRECQALLEAVGEAAWIADEGLMDAVTAVSGSGPAYVFLLIEALAEAGRIAGLPAELALRLARATVAGAGELVHRSTEPAATLRQNVTSPGGTTAAALSILMAPDGLAPLMTRAVAAAVARGRELGG